MAGVVEAELSTHYTEISQRLRNGNGHAKPDTPIDLRPPRRKPAPVPSLQAQITALEERMMAAEERIGFLMYCPKGILHKLLDVICANEGVSRIAIESQRRDHRAVIPRQLFCYLAITYTKKTLKQIGFVIGNRDHTTVMHGRDKIEGMILELPELAEKVAWYKERIALLTKDSNC